MTFLRAMQEAIDVFSNMTYSEDMRVSALYMLRELVEPIDNANGAMLQVRPATSICNTHNRVDGYKVSLASVVRNKSFLLVDRDRPVAT